MMSYVKLDSSEQFNDNNDYLIYFFYSVKEVDPIHSHDFFEIFYVFSGCAKHIVNNRIVKISEGDLVFMRPNDVHTYFPIGENIFKFINLSFSASIFNNLYNYFSPCSILRSFLHQDMPYSINLNPIDRENVLQSFKSFHLMSNTSNESMKASVKVLIANLYHKYLMALNFKKKEYVPSAVWFKEFMVKLENPSFFTNSSQKIISTTGKTREHVSRVFRKTVGISLQEYLIDKKINYACGLLKNTDMDIIDIAEESGFSNLSTFYHCFKKKVNVSPKSLRK